MWEVPGRADTERSPVVDFMNRPNPYMGLGGHVSEIPDLVTLQDFGSEDPSEIALGWGPQGRVVVDLDSESPHILVNAPTGLGKSTVARSVAVQRLVQGDLVVVLDRKMHSHMWAHPLAPLVHYADTTELIGAGLVNLGYELHRRNQVIKSGEGDLGPRIVVIFEETNATLSQLKVLDKRNVAGGYGALDAFGDIMFMGRAVRIHMVCFAQLASYRSGLSAELLENFGAKVLIGHSPQAWKWLASDCGRYQVAPSIKGRGMVCQSGKAVETQLILVDEGWAQAMVLASDTAQARARQLAGGRAGLSEVWRKAIGR